MYDVKSPDGFSIEREELYKSLKEANTALNKFVKRFEKQGYYSSVNYGKIKLKELKNYCKIFKV
jgi:hypothetical protein